MKKILVVPIVLLLLASILTPAEASVVSKIPNVETVEESSALTPEEQTIVDQVAPEGLPTLTPEEQAIVDQKVAEILDEIDADNAVLQKENSFSTLSAPPVNPYYTEYTVATRYNNNYEHAQAILHEYNYMRLNISLASATAFKYTIFAKLVKSGGAWDLKQYLGKNTQYWLRGNLRTGEFVGNHHYGYMGRVLGFSETTLSTSAGLYQIVSGTSDWSFFTSYFDDPADQAAIQNGFAVYDKGVIYFY